MKLEVGKTYKTRDGQIVKITAYAGGVHWPFSGELNGVIDFWESNGVWSSGKTESDKDLIEEVNTDENERTT